MGYIHVIICAVQTECLSLVGICKSGIASQSAVSIVPWHIGCITFEWIPGKQALRKGRWFGWVKWICPGRNFLCICVRIPIVIRARQVIYLSDLRRCKFAVIESQIINFTLEETSPCTSVVIGSILVCCTYRSVSGNKFGTKRAIVMNHMWAVKGSIYIKILGGGIRIIGNCNVLPNIVTHWTLAVLICNILRIFRSKKKFSVIVLPPHA